ncbi:MAG: hypothetical protein WC560_10140 [Syntrophales bacterium]
MANRLRTLWILLQGVFLPLVYFSGKYEGSPLGTMLLFVYVGLVYADAILTCKLFEPKDKAK